MSDPQPHPAHATPQPARQPVRPQAPTHPHPPAKKKGSGLILTGWILLLLGLVALGCHLKVPALAFPAAVLTFAAFVFAIIILVKKRILAGVLLLLASLILPAIVAFLSVAIPLALEHAEKLVEQEKQRQEQQQQSNDIPDPR